MLYQRSLSHFSSHSVSFVVLILSASCSFPSTSHLSTPSNIKLTLIKSNSLCADRSGKEYSYGGFDSQTTLDQCFNSCAVDKALFLSKMVGVDWNCGTGACDWWVCAFVKNYTRLLCFDMCYHTVTDESISFTSHQLVWSLHAKQQRLQGVW